MPIEIYGLTDSQKLMLKRLDDGPEEDSVGLELGELSTAQMQVFDRLVDRELVTFSCGWNMTFWYRLTPRGWAVLRSL